MESQQGGKNRPDHGGWNMEIRELTPEERFDAELISTVAFHGRIEDLQKKKEEVLKEQAEDWGAFSDQGKLMAHIINNHYTVHFDGVQVPCGGIGAVSTLPEYREEGCIRAIFGRLLHRARERGEILSALYPFCQAFYRKFGYETVCKENVYTFAPEVLREYSFGGKAVMYAPEDNLQPYMELYTQFAARYNLAAVRSESMMREHLKGNCYQERKFTYLLSEEETSVAYLTFVDVKGEKGPHLKVQDLAWEGRKGFEAILGFLSRFTADYARIDLPLPLDIELLSLIHSWKAYDIEKRTEQSYMVRVVNVPELLKRLAVQEGTVFTIRVQDELLPENCGTWKVTHGSAEAVSEPPDLIVSIQALAQMTVGEVSLYEAALRSDVTVVNMSGTLSGVFVRKPLYMAEHF